MHVTRRRWLTWFAGLSVPGGLLAQSLPPLLRMLCGYPPGGVLDIVSRKLAEHLGGKLAVQAIVDNRPGAAGRLAVEELKRSAGDGLTLLLTPASVMTMYPHVYRRLGYDVFADVKPVSTVASFAFALSVGPAVPPSVRGMGDFARWCRAEPERATCANPGAGSMPHFMAVLLARETGIEMRHIPYRGGPAAMLAIAAGDVAAAMTTESLARTQHEAGRIRVLATSGRTRSPLFPGAATFGELGWPALTQQEWYGAFVSAATADAIVRRTADALHAALESEDVRQAWDRVGLAIESSTPEQLGASLRREFEFWGPVIKSSGFTPES